MQDSEWFKGWFDSPYYHILYKNRNDKEAADFIDKLADHLKLNENDFIWDLACGKGRHSVYLNKKELNVTGTDLSENSIAYASQFENSRLEFFVHDMRRPFRINYFTCVLNLFTSIGYFDNYKDNVKVFENVFAALKPKGSFVIDFLNENYVVKHLIPFEEKEIENIKFRIKKEVKDKHIIKTISFVDKGVSHSYQEKVSLLKYEDFLFFSDRSGFKLKEVFGNYKLEPFDKENSDRLILIFEK